MAYQYIVIDDQTFAVNTEDEIRDAKAELLLAGIDRASIYAIPGCPVGEDYSDSVKTSSVLQRLDSIIQTTVEMAARETAELFVDEFPGESLDPAKTDWDSTAWEDDSIHVRRLNVSEDIKGRLVEYFWPIYQAELISQVDALNHDAKLLA